MRLFTHHLHLPLSNRAMVPPPSMWRELRDRLDRLSHSPAKEARLRVQGQVDLPESDVLCSLAVVVDGELKRMRDIQGNGKFRLDLPAAEPVRLVFIQFGYLPRVIEIRPCGNDARSSKAQRLDLRVALTRAATVGGVRPSPLRERITLGHGGGPLTVEYDRAARAERQDDFWPLLKRAS